MYADRNTRFGGLNPASMGLAVLINIAAVAALLLANPDLQKILVDPPLPIFNVPTIPPPDPVPLPDTPQPRAAPQQPIDRVTPIVKPVETRDDVVLPPISPQPFPSGTGPSGGSGVTVDPVKPAPPVLTKPGIDARYAKDFQPLYPPSEQRMGRDGRVIVRVLVGVDGRVKQIEPVSATSDAFFKATAERAMSKWRFTPGTRDGIPVEAWRTMTLTFVIQD